MAWWVCRHSDSSWKDSALNLSSRLARLRSRLGAISTVLVVAALNLLLVMAWTTWWHVGALTSDAGMGDVLGSLVEFLAWTFLPCWAVALVILTVTTPLVRRVRRPGPVLLRALLTLLAPLLWALAYCWFYDDLGYTPTAALVAEGAWVVTLQPLWTYLALFRLQGDMGDERTTEAVEHDSFRVDATSELVG